MPPKGTAAMRRAKQPAKKTTTSLTSSTTPSNYLKNPLSKTQFADHYCNYVHPSLRLVTTLGGRGVVASSFIPKGTLLIQSLPAAVAPTYTNGSHQTNMTLGLLSLLQFTNYGQDTKIFPELHNVTQLPGLQKYDELLSTGISLDGLSHAINTPFLFPSTEEISKYELGNAFIPPNAEPGQNLSLKFSLPVGLTPQQQKSALALIETRQGQALLQRFVHIARFNSILVDYSPEYLVYDNTIPINTPLNRVVKQDNESHTVAKEMSNEANEANEANDDSPDSLFIHTSHIRTFPSIVEESQPVMCIFPLLSLLNHSCTPNAIPHIFLTPDESMLNSILQDTMKPTPQTNNNILNQKDSTISPLISVITAHEDIYPGQEITFNYIPLISTEGTTYLSWLSGARSKLTSDHHRFICECVRCKVSTCDNIPYRLAQSRGFLKDLLSISIAKNAFETEYTSHKALQLTGLGQTMNNTTTTTTSTTTIVNPRIGLTLGTVINDSEYQKSYKKYQKILRSWRAQQVNRMVFLEAALNSFHVYIPSIMRIKGETDTSTSSEDQLLDTFSVTGVPKTVEHGFYSLLLPQEITTLAELSTEERQQYVFTTSPSIDTRMDGENNRFSDIGTAHSIISTLTKPQKVSLLQRSAYFQLIMKVIGSNIPDSKIPRQYKLANPVDVKQTIIALLQDSYYEAVAHIEDQHQELQQSVVQADVNVEGEGEGDEDIEEAVEEGFEEGESDDSDSEAEAEVEADEETNTNDTCKSNIDNELDIFKVFNSFTNDLPSKYTFEMINNTTPSYSSIYPLYFSLPGLGVIADLDKTAEQIAKEKMDLIIDMNKIKLAQEAAENAATIASTTGTVNTVGDAKSRGIIMENTIDSLVRLEGKLSLDSQRQIPVITSGPRYSNGNYAVNIPTINDTLSNNVFIEILKLYDQAFSILVHLAQIDTLTEQNYQVLAAIAATIEEYVSYSTQITGSFHWIHYLTNAILGVCYYYLQRPVESLYSRIICYTIGVLSLPSTHRSLSDLVEELETAFQNSLTSDEDADTGKISSLNMNTVDVITKELQNIHMGGGNTIDIDVEMSRPSLIYQNLSKQLAQLQYYCINACEPPKL